MNLLFILAIAVIPYGNMDIVSHNIDGNNYGCFSEEWTKNLLQLRLDAPKLMEEIVLLKEAGTIKDNQIYFYEEIMKNCNKQLLEYSEEIRVLNNKSVDSSSWLASKWLWLGIGVALGIGSTITILKSVK
jgi:hypothetical protein